MSKRSRAEKLVGKVIAHRGDYFIRVDRVEAGQVSDLQDQEAVKKWGPDKAGLSFMVWDIGLIILLGMGISL